MRRKWTAEKISEVLDYRKAHTHTETLAHFKISSGQLHLFKTGKTYKRNANDAHRGNWHDVLDMEQKDALMHLERWRAAYLASIKNETPSAVELLRALQGKK